VVAVGVVTNPPELAPTAPRRPPLYWDFPRLCSRSPGASRCVTTTPQLSLPDGALSRAKGEERWNVSGSTFIAERHVVELEQQIGRQRSVLDQLVSASRSERDIDLARSALATLESRLRFAQDHLRFERMHYSPQHWNLAK
jgi:hypothetical protein